MMSADSAMPLRGFRVLVTRPEHQAKSLCQAIEQRGGQAISLPAVAIQSVPITLLPDQSIDIAIFLSANAVRHSQAWWQRWSQKPRFFAVGPATAAALKTAGFAVESLPETYSSEGLLEMFKETRGKTIYLCCGEASRPLLRDQLFIHNTLVPIICYRRQPVLFNESHRHLLFDKLDYSVTTSQAILSAFYDLLIAAEATSLLARPLVVTDKKHRVLAECLGFQKVLLAKDAQTEHIIEVIVADINARITLN